MKSHHFGEIHILVKLCHFTFFAFFAILGGTSHLRARILYIFNRGDGRGGGATNEGVVICLGPFKLAEELIIQCRVFSKSLKDLTETYSRRQMRSPAIENRCGAYHLTQNHRRQAGQWPPGSVRAVCALLVDTKQPRHCCAALAIRRT